MPSRDGRLVHEVVQLAREGMKRRAIARALRMSRNTVREILEDHAVARTEVHSALPRQRSVTRSSKLDDFRAQIVALLEKYPDITAQRVFEELREKGYAGGSTIIKSLVRKLRKAAAPTPSLETPPRVPGEMAECDWSPYEVSFTHAPKMMLQAFGYTLRYSTRKYFGFHEGNGLHPLMDGHVHAFARFGGAAGRCKYDVQKPAVLRWEGGQPIYNPRFIDFATHYDFSPVACHPRSPDEKPRVERSFYELTLSFFRGRSFRNREDLAGQLVHWMDTVADNRPLKRMRRRTRLELFAEELPLLRPLPRHDYDTARVLYRICDIEGFIAWEANWYSLPYEYVTELLPIRITENELFVYKADLTCIARHALRPRGAQEYAILDGHRPRLADRGPDLDQLRSAFAGIDPGAAAFLAAMEKAQPRSAAYHGRKILSLRERWGTADLTAALEHALEYGALDNQAVERILLVRGTPRRLDEYVAQASAEKLDSPLPVRPRDLTEYDALPTRASSPHPNQEPVPCKSAPPPDPRSPKTNSGGSASGT